MRCALVIFAKAPVAGFAKTRLIPGLGPEGAAQLAERLLHNALEHARSSTMDTVELCCAPDGGHPVLQASARRYGATLSAQGEGDLGARMLRAFERCLQTHDATIIIGTDAPLLNATYLRQAREALQTAPAVFGPAHDGGYTLIGLRQAHASLFDAMPWSTPAVMPQNRIRLADLGIAHTELPYLHDVDEPEDLVHVPTHWLNSNSPFTCDLLP